MTSLWEKRFRLSLQSQAENSDGAWSVERTKEGIRPSGGSKMDKHKHLLRAAAATLRAALLLTLAAGCGGAGGAAGGSALAIAGQVHGGQNPVSGSAVTLWQAGTGGYGQGATSLAVTTTDSTGHFALNFSCPYSGVQVYLTAQGGNPGAGTNSALQMLAALGNCANLPNTFSVDINELTTVASVWALARFINTSGGAVTARAQTAGPPVVMRTAATGILDIGAPFSNATGLANAMALVANLVDVATGLAPASLAPEVVSPAAELNTIADILQDCVNSNGSSSTACQNLFSCVVPGSTPGTGNSAPCTVPAGAAQPQDTLSAALEIALNPANNVVALFNLTSATPAFAPPLGSAPNAWTVALTYTGGGLDHPSGIAIDASGNAWIANPITGAGVAKLSPLGASLSGSVGFLSGGLNGPAALAIDLFGNAWVGDGGATAVMKLSPSGSPLSGNSGYTVSVSVGGVAIEPSGNVWVVGVGNPSSVVELNSSGSTLLTLSSNEFANANPPALDAVGNLWIANYGSPSGVNSSLGTIAEVSPGGAFLSPSSGCASNATPCGYTAGTLNNPQGIAIDPLGNAWVTNFFGNNVSEIDPSGNNVGSSPYSGGGLSAPFGIAVDSSGNVWVANYQFSPAANSITELSPSGAALSPSTGFTQCVTQSCTNDLKQPTGIAIDASGNVWVTNLGNLVAEFVGAAAPVLVPTVACIARGQSVCLP